jgi:hypothetical protein
MGRKGSKSQSHSKSQSAKSFKRNSSKNSSLSKGRGRPKKHETDLLNKFQRGEDRTLKAEVLWNCIIRRMLRKIEKRFNETDEADKKLKDINEFIHEVEILIDNHRTEITEDKTKWENELGRTQQNKNRQYNQREIGKLLQSSLLLEIYNAFVSGLLSAPENVKLEVLNLKSWPEDGDFAMHQILRPDYIQDLLEETRHEPAQGNEMVYPLPNYDSPVFVEEPLLGPTEAFGNLLDQLSIYEPYEPPETSFLNEREPVKPDYD